MLARALGFSDPFPIMGKSGESRLMIGLKSLPTDLSRTNSLPPEILNRLHARKNELEQELILLEGAPSVATALREIRAKHGVGDAKLALETALSIVSNILKQPRDLRMYRIKKGNPTFNRNLGQFHGASLLMNSIGFNGDSDGAYVLRQIGSRMETNVESRDGDG